MASLYPDGSTNPAWNPNLRVIIPLRTTEASPTRVPSRLVRSVVCHRIDADGREEYLVQWRSTSRTPPYSWHPLNELSECLLLLQQYIERLKTSKPILRNPSHILPQNLARGIKRKSSESDDGSSSRASIARSSPALSFTSSSTDTSITEPRVYNGTLVIKDGHYGVHKPTSDTAIASNLPAAQMLAKASRTDVRQALHRIAGEFDARLNRSFAGTGQPSVRISPPDDGTRPPLSFTFIAKSVLGEGVHAADDATVVGCGLVKSSRKSGNNTRCNPHMGQDIGCEYGRLCECLEYAAVDEARLTTQEKLLHDAGDVANLPKRFPYHNPNGPRGGCLVGFYIKSRHPIYECNKRCNCGPSCKTRVVQWGRKVPLEIFKTENRGWGLRCTMDLQEGQFIDTYRGEIITNEEADHREEATPKGKASYFYSLDKHVDSGENGLTAEECYVVDGEVMGGPTRFINHSCAPNCRQYTVSTNKFDTRIYDIAFFACQPIKAYTELTFDYLDKDDDDEDNDTNGNAEQGVESESTTAIPCHCGAPKCRGTLWR